MQLKSFSLNTTEIELFNFEFHLIFSFKIGLKHLNFECY